VSFCATSAVSAKDSDSEMRPNSSRAVASVITTLPRPTAA
jgi:hypothetical protein